MMEWCRSVDCSRETCSTSTSMVIECVIASWLVGGGEGDWRMSICGCQMLD